MFGFEHASERHSMSSSYGPSAMDDEMTYMHHADGLKDGGRDQSEQIISCSVAPQMMAVKINNSFTITFRTRKRGKAQRVARPACTNADVHFLLTYRLAMLLPPSE